MNGRSRFVSGVEDNFESFIDLYNENDWAKFLDDKGVGTVPDEYLAAIELGLRNYHKSVHAMGTHPLRSPSFWGNKVDLWRKREAYIALARNLLGSKPEYQQWDCFLFSDYTQRQRLTLTFVKRHLPLSDGDDEHFNGHLKFDWAEHAFTLKRKKSRSPKEEPTVVKRVRRKPKNVKPPSRQNVKNKKPMVYDVEKGVLVPM